LTKLNAILLFSPVWYSSDIPAHILIVERLLSAAPHVRPVMFSSLTVPIVIVFECVLIPGILTK
jgi:hypothetical protein